jgi:hypothetical protein
MKHMQSPIKWVIICVSLGLVRWEGENDRILLLCVETKNLWSFTSFVYKRFNVVVLSVVGNDLVRRD